MLKETNPKIEMVISPVSVAHLQKKADERFGDMVKAAVDIEKHIMAIGGELHADEEAMLLEQESKQENLWGINIRPPARYWPITSTELTTTRARRKIWKSIFIFLPTRPGIANCCSMALQITPFVHGTTTDNEKGIAVDQTAIEIFLDI